MARNKAGGTGNFMSYSTNAVLTAYPIGMFAWIRPTNTTGSHHGTVIGSTGGSDYFILSCQGARTGDPVSAYRGTGGIDDFADSSAAFVANTWNACHAGFYSSTSVAAGVAGGNVGTDVSNKTPTIGTGRTQVGGYTPSSTCFGSLNGDVAEAAIWDLTAWGADAAARKTAFEAIWPSLAAGFAPSHWPLGLVFYAPLIGKYSPEVELIGGRVQTITGTVVAAEHPRIIYPRYGRTITVASAGGAYSLAIDGGSYSLTGAAVGLKRGYPIVVAGGAYAITGEIVSLIRGRPIIIGSGTYTITGSNVGLAKGSKVTVGGGSYTITGATVGLKHGYAVTIATEAYALTGAAVMLRRGYPVAVAGGSYTLTGATVGLKRGYPITVSGGTYTITGANVTLRSTHTLSIGGGAYSLTGASIGLTYSGAGNKTLTIDPGSYSLTGAAVTLRAVHVLAIAGGTYAVTGAAVDLTFSGELIIAVRAATLQRADPDRTFRRADAPRLFQRADPSRTFQRIPAMSAQVQRQTRTKKVSEVVLFVFDFSNFPEVEAGETLSSPTAPAVSGLTIGSPAITTEEQDGIPAGQALQVSISGGTAGTDYTVSAYVVTSGGSTRGVEGIVAVRA